jgi:hypothetical protein
MFGLLTPGFKRKLAQVLVSGLFAVISIPSILLLVLIGLHVIAPLQGGMRVFAAGFLTALSYPLDNETLQFITLVVAVLPAIVAVVCFEVDTVDDKPVASSRLNRLGKIAVIGLLVGVIASFVLLLIFNIASGFVNQLVQDSAITKATKLVIAGIVSFQSLYFLKLLGIEDAVAGKQT